MKASGILIVGLFMILAFTAGNAHAEKTIAVKKGDTLWQISRVEFSTGLRWVDLAIKNDIADPRKLQIGFILTIPAINVDITNHQASSYGAKAVKGDKRVLSFIKATEVEENIKDVLEQVVKVLDPEPYVLMKGETAKYVSNASGVYGNNFTEFTFNWRKVDLLESWRWSVVLDSICYELIVIDARGNATLRWREIEIETAGSEDDEIVIAEGEAAK